MKKLFALMRAALLAMALLVPALADATDAAADTAEAVVEETEAAADEAAEAVEEAAEAEAPAVSPVFKKLLEVPWYTWAVLGVLVAAGVLLALNGKKIRCDSRSLSMGAMSIAIAFVLSCIRLYRMPQGGSITPASMLPLILFMVACGPLKGFIVGCVFGLLKLLADPYIIHPVQLLMDYPLAYGAMILGCLATLFPLKDQWKLPIAVLLACIARWIMSVLSGVIFFAESAGEQNALVYSMVYNLSYMAPDALVCILVSCIPGMPRLVNMIRKKA